MCSLNSTLPEVNLALVMENVKHRKGEEYGASKWKF